MDAQRRTLIDRYREGYAEVVSALAGMTSAEIDRRPRDGGWSARQIVHHLADSETTSYIRLRRLVAEDSPVIVSYDEELFAQRLHYDRPIDLSLAVLAAVRAASAELLEHLTDDQWQRAGSHSDSGRYAVTDWLQIYAAHAHDHADQIRRARTGA
ncbi:MAG TPA: DinB family protein [Acidimicrobiales bacterium]